MLTIYILKLEQNKYYVGKTKNPTKRLQDHFDDIGPEFTKKYKPLDIEKIIPNCDDYDEDKYVKIYMDKYGIDNVRGGSYCNEELTPLEKKILTKNIQNASDKCFRCDKVGHFIKECPLSNYDLSKKESNIVCYKCNQNGHYSTSCTNTNTNTNINTNNNNIIILENITKELQKKLDNLINFEDKANLIKEQEKVIEELKTKINSLLIQIETIKFNNEVYSKLLIQEYNKIIQELRNEIETNKSENEVRINSVIIDHKYKYMKYNNKIKSIKNEYKDKIKSLELIIENHQCKIKNEIIQDTNITSKDYKKKSKSKCIRNLIKKFKK